MERWKRFEKLGAIKSVNKKDQRLMVLAIFVFPYLWVWHDFISGKPAYLGHYTFSPRQRISYKNEKVYFDDMEFCEWFNSKYANIWLSLFTVR